MSSSAGAAEFTINDQEQANIQIMCDVAARSPELSRETRANVAGFCLLWERRVKEAAEKAAAPKVSDKQK